MPGSLKMSGFYGIVDRLERLFERSTCVINFFGVTRRLTVPNPGRDVFRQRDGQARGKW